MTFHDNSYNCHCNYTYDEVGSTICMIVELGAFRHDLMLNTEFAVSTGNTSVIMCCCTVVTF